MVSKLAWFLFPLLYFPKLCWGQSSWTNVEESTCKFTTNHGLTIPFDRNPLLFIEQVYQPNVKSCRDMCCNHKTCNGYVWDVTMNNNQPCKLLKCSDEGTDCKNALTKTSISDKSQHEVGFITGITDTTPSPLEDVLITNAPTITTTTTKTTYRMPTTTTTTKTTPRLDLHTTTTISTPLVKNFNVQATTTTSPESTVTSTQSTLSPKQTTTLNKDEDSIMAKILESQKSKLSTITTTGVPTVKQKFEEDETPSPTNPTTSSTMTRKKNTHSKTSKNSTTKIPAHKEVIERGKGNGHSDNIALTAAVFFGLAFMFVTIYLVGRRWLEGIRESKSRRSYTRISFLLNGDDRT